MSKYKPLPLIINMIDKRKQLGLSQVQVAEKIGIANTRLCEYEIGRI